MANALNSFSALLARISFLAHSVSFGTHNAASSLAVATCKDRRTVVKFSFLDHMTFLSFANFFRL